MIRPVGVRENPLEVAVLGAGYVGLVTAACLARLGVCVTSIDTNVARVEGLRHGIMPFFETGLEDAVREGVSAGRLTFATSIAAAHGAHAAFIAVGTLDGEAEWTPRDVERAVIELAADHDAPRTIVVRSTLMPGTTVRLATLARQRDGRVELALNPKFTRQGSALSDFLNPDRIVFGLTVAKAESRALPILGEAYANVTGTVVVTDSTSAEMIKVGANVFLAMKIGFANEMARLSAATGADVMDVVDGIGLDARIGRPFMTPGPGVGGSCLPSQSRSLPTFAREHAVSTPIIDAVDRSNSMQADWFAEQVEREVGDLRGRRIAVLGLTFKHGTDDVRESPSLRLGRVLAERGASVAGHDPLGGAAAVAAAERTDFEFELAPTVADAACNADAILLATDWPEYRSIDWTRIAPLMRGTSVFDSRVGIDASAARDAGLNVVVHGRAVADIA